MLSWKPTDEILLYASYSSGYKAGGFNLDRSALTRQTVINPSTGATVARRRDHSGHRVGAICSSTRN